MKSNTMVNQRYTEENVQRKETALSIIIPTLNEEHYLPILLSSIALQDFKDYEVVVADADSEDRTIEIAQEYGCRIVLGGRLPAIGRNNGAKVAIGKYLLFLDADTVLPRNFLKMAISELESRNLSIASCKINPLSSKKFDIAFCHMLNSYFLLTQHIYPHAAGFCIIVRKHINDIINGFDESIKLAEDHDYVNRAKRYGTFGILHSSKVPVSMRRLDIDGRLNVAAVYLLSELYRITLGEIRTDFFNYKFAHYDRRRQYKVHDSTANVVRLLSGKESIYRANNFNLLKKVKLSSRGIIGSKFTRRW